jgi:hypothetical protein
MRDRSIINLKTRRAAVSSYRISTRKTAILDRKYEIPGLYLSLKHKRKLRKLWQGTRDPACKMEVNCVTRNIRRRTRKRIIETWETKLQNAKSHLKQYGLLQNPSQKGMVQRHFLPFMISYAPYFIQSIKLA